jgi:6-phosphogluconolactonase
MKLLEYPDRDSLMAQVAHALAEDLRTALNERPRVSFAVPGGTTPGPVFDALSRTALDWSRVHILLTDERWVPEHDPQSNAALIRSRLLTGHAQAARFTPYYRAGTAINARAVTLSHDLAPLLPIDVMLLGMGADMHTASLFPGAEGLAAALAPEAPMLLPMRVPGQAAERFSLSAPVLRHAKLIHVLITGADKRDALTRAAPLPEADAPIKIVLPKATVHWSAT